MIELDGDEIRISSRGRYAERDIVQVPVCVLSSNLEAFLKHFYFLNWLKCKTRQWGVRKPSDIRRIDLERQGSVCPRVLHRLRQTAKTTSESRQGVVQNCHLVTSTPGRSGPQMAPCTHAEQMARPQYLWRVWPICLFLIILGVQITSSLTWQLRLHPARPVASLDKLFTSVPWNIMNYGTMFFL